MDAGEPKPGVTPLEAVKPTQPFDKTAIPDHIVEEAFLSSEQIARLNSEGHRFNSETIRLVDECRDALERMPIGSKGIVIGPGYNATAWHSKGWETIDILDSVKPTYVADANRLREIVGNDYDYVMSEYVTMNEIAGHSTPVVSPKTFQVVNYEPAVGHENLLIQAGAILKARGRLIVQTVDFGETPVSLPKSEAYASLMRKHGFAPVLEIRDIEDFSNPEKRKHGVRVIWYAEKVK